MNTNLNLYIAQTIKIVMKLRIMPSTMNVLSIYLGTWTIAHLLNESVVGSCMHDTQLWTFDWLKKKENEESQTNDF